MGPEDWYRNPNEKTGERMEERASRRPKTVPDDPPTEFHRIRDWPPEWGPYPYSAPARGEVP